MLIAVAASTASAERTSIIESNVSLVATGSSEFIPSAAANGNQWGVVMSPETNGGGDHQASFDRSNILIAFALLQCTNKQSGSQTNSDVGWILAQIGEKWNLK